MQPTILLLRLPEGVTAESLRLTVPDRLEIVVDPARVAPRAGIAVKLRLANGRVGALHATVAIETSLEVETLRNGGMMLMILAGLKPAWAG